MSAWRDFADLARQTWRHAWRWVLWSPRRWLGVLVVLVTVGVAWSAIASNRSAGPGPETEDYGDLPTGWETWPTVTATGEPVPSESASATDESSDESSADLVEHTGTDDDHEVSTATRDRTETLADDFATAYLRDVKQATWLGGVRKYTTEELGQAFKTVDPRNIPARGTRPGAVTITSLSEYGGVADVSTNAGVLTVEMAFSGSKWQVTAVRPPEPRRDDGAGG